MTSPLEKALRGLIISGVFLLTLVPLIVADTFFFPYITGKNFAFRIIVEVIASAYLALAIAYPQYRPRRSWILGAFALFVLAIAIADAQGVNAFKSFWSNFERMDGWVTLAHLLAYLVVAAAVMNTEKLWRWFFQVSMGVSVLISILGYGQLFLGGGGTGGLANRIDATFGNPIYLAVYMLFHVFFAALLWVQMWGEKKPGERWPLATWYGIVIVLDTIALLFTGTRGTILGLVGGIVLTAILLVLFAWRSRTAWRLAIGSIIGILVVAGGFWSVRDTSFIRSIGALDRLGTLSLTDTTVVSRLLNIGIAWQGVKERPIFGWGQENYAIVFDKYYDPRMYNDEPWFDRVHDVIFDWLVAGGFVGLLTYLSIFAAIIAALWKRGRNGEVPFSIAERSILTGLLAGYFFHNLFVFDNVTSYILFASVAAYIVYRRSASLKSLPIMQGADSPASLPYAAGGAALLALGLVWAVNVPGIQQNLTLLNGLRQQPQGVSRNIEYFKQAIGYGAMGTQEAREQLIQEAGQIANSSAIDTATKQQILQFAADQMQLQSQASPLDARFPLFLGVLLDAYGDYKDAGIALQKAHELSPRKQSIDFEVGMNAIAQGNTAAGLAAFKEAFDLDQGIVGPRVTYAAAAIQTGNDALADQLLAPVIPTGEAATQQIASVYAQRKEYGKIVEIWQQRIKAAPSDVQAYFTLAAGYYGIGQKQKSIDTLRAAAAEDPSVKAQAEALIQQVESGTVQL